jgi:hypothetical protein
MVPHEWLQLPSRAEILQRREARQRSIRDACAQHGGPKPEAVQSLLEAMSNCGVFFLLPPPPPQSSSGADESKNAFTSSESHNLPP